MHAVDPSTGEREWTTHLEAPAVRAFTVGFGGDGGGAVAENGDTDASNTVSTTIFA